MSANYFSTTRFRNRSFDHISLPAVQQLSDLALQYPGKTVFITRFTPEDQLLTHLIVEHALPVRVVADSESAPYDILMRSVDFFKGNIELSTRQSRQAAHDFEARYPSVAQAYAERPAIRPLVQVLSGHHLLVSAVRKDGAQLPLLWDEARQRAVVHPLFNWTDRQVWSYLQAFGIPTQQRPPEVVFPREAAGASIWRRAAILLKSKKKSVIANGKPERFTGVLQAPALALGFE